MNLAKISNRSTSTHINDGLKLDSTYLTNILKCVPPGDKPKKNELDNCSSFLNYEINYLKNLKVICSTGSPLSKDSFEYIYNARVFL